MNLIEDLLPSSAEYAMATTYPFDLRFYTEYLSREFSDVGVASPVILMDYDHYQENLSDGTWKPGAIGGSYYLEPVEAGSVFHPKISVSTSEDQVHVAITSSNLTLNEMTSAAQLGTQYILNRDEVEDDPQTAVIQDVLAFVDELRENYVGRNTGTQLARLIDAGSWATEVTAPQSETTHFVQNISTPILDQITDNISDVERLQLAAPFFGSPDSVATIVDRIDPQTCDLLIDEGTTHVDLEAVVASIECATSVRRLDYPTSRWIHGKFMCFLGNDWSGCLYGSPNHTGRALLKTADDGNLEAGILRLEPDPEYFSGGPPLFESEPFHVTISEEVQSENLTTNSYEGITKKEGSSDDTLRLSDVYIEAESSEEIHITLALEPHEEISIRDYTGIVTVLSDETKTSISWDEPSESLVQREGDLIVGKATVPPTWKNTIIRVELEDGTFSNYRQVTTEPTPYTGPQGDMLSTGGRKGVQNLIWNLIFRNDPKAGESLSRTAIDIKDRLQESDSGGSQIVEDNDSDSWTVGGGGRSSGSSNRSPHLQLQDSLELSLTNLKHFTDQDPNPEYAQEVVEHFENYWTAIEAAFIRNLISDQLTADESVIVEFDSDKLVEVAREKLEPLHFNNLLEDIGDYIAESLEGVPNETEYIDGKQSFKCLFAHPAVVLGLDSAVSGEGINPYYFVEDVFEPLSNVPPVISDYLLDPNAATEQYDKILERYYEGIELLKETYDCSLELPDRLSDSNKVLLYTIWYQELGEHDTDLPLFQKIAQSDRYDYEDLQELGKLMLVGRDQLELYTDLSEFRDGSLRAIAKGLSGSGSKSREKQIEDLAE